ncbi:hypothetical protein Syun_023342 [Stephania yunnanensis]|uniref:Uncharacterized protein n=1 Tax=Stephania yunnanensis TaxID=152371 RepID=A0AAP0F8U5_9MAGN
MAKICLWTFHSDTDGSMHFRFHKMRRTSYRHTVMHSTLRGMRMMWRGNHIMNS